MLALLSLASSYKYLVIKYANTGTERDGEREGERDRGREKEGGRARGRQFMFAFVLSFLRLFFVFDYLKPSLTAFFFATPTPTLCVFN